MNSTENPTLLHLVTRVWRKRQKTRFAASISVFFSVFLVFLIFSLETIVLVHNFSQSHLKMEHIQTHVKTAEHEMIWLIWLGNQKDQMHSRDQISVLEIWLNRLRQCLLKWLEEALWNETWHLFSTVCQDYLVANLKSTKSACVCIFEKKKKRVSSSRRLI